MPSKKETLLEKRIREFEVPPIPWFPTFDRALAYQIPDAMTDQEKIGSIYIPEELRSTKDGSKRLLLVAAGLKALDILRSNGIELGHIITETQFGNVDYIVDRKEMGENVKFRVLRAEDVAGDEDLLENLKKGLVKIVLDDAGKHQFTVDPETRGPVNPFAKE